MTEERLRVPKSPMWKVLPDLAIVVGVLSFFAAEMLWRYLSTGGAVFYALFVVSCAVVFVGAATAAALYFLQLWFDANIHPSVCYPVDSFEFWAEKFLQYPGANARVVRCVICEEQGRVGYALSCGGRFSSWRVPMCYRCNEESRERYAVPRILRVDFNRRS